MGKPPTDGHGASAAPHQAPYPGSQGGAGRSLLQRLPWELRFLVLSPFYIGIPALIALTASFVYYTAMIPNPMALRAKERAPVIRILARDGTLLTDRGGAEAYVPLDLVPQQLIDAVVATEDKRFFEHWGLDPVGLLRAAYTNLRSGRVSQGGSTITQQLAKNLFLTSERSLARKAEELVLALWLEARLGKRNILELYLNRVYFGAGAYGVEAAAQRYFSKSTRQLTLPESAVLAGLLKAPSKFSPISAPESARARARTVLSKMVEANVLSADLAEIAANAPLAFADRHQARDKTGVDYAVDAVLEKIPQLTAGKGGDLVVETTIDLPLQKRAQALVQEALADGNSSEASQAGMVAMDLDGAIRVLVGGRSYAESQFNRALRAKRQPGSSFKMFVYLAALETGMRPDSIVHDLPLLGSGWSPRNESAGYRGSVTMREALTHSMNAATARLHMSIGPKKTAAVARRLGITSELRADASLALGTSEVTLIELTEAYGVIANQGRSMEPYFIKRIRTSGGEVVFQHEAPPAQTLVAPQQVVQLNDMLMSVVQNGTGKRAQIPRHQVAGKTGTSQDFRDAWFVGYTAHMVGGVWIGNDDRRPMNRVMGGNLPARLWRDVMAQAHESKPPMPLPLQIQQVSAPPAKPATAAAARFARAPMLPQEPIEAELFDKAANDDRPIPPEPIYGPDSRSRQMDGLLKELGLGKR
ncbi:MAG: PBP1A family penicillin-binding protein [Hyphomicrobiales bacterium]|nr:MAG: PBP1A family penicillin-binding protein [Hyphomicrobiales bacterium]